MTEKPDEKNKVDQQDGSIEENENIKESDCEEDSLLSMLPIGLGLGISFGLLFDQLTMGISLGLCFGVALGVYKNKSR